jgi:two-component system, chemotaxis family, chemotaxis protein CheY
MKTLIVEDDFTSRVLLQEFLKGYGPLHVAVNGRECIDAVRIALDANEPYNLICLDIKMPEMDGHAALRKIRMMEEKKGIDPSKRTRIFMTTALADKANVIEAIKGQCDYFLAKPIEKKVLIKELQRFNLIESQGD